MVPDGFSVDTFTTDVQAPRAMVLAPNGDIFPGRNPERPIKVMRPGSDYSNPDSITVFAQGLLQPLGIALTLRVIILSGCISPKPIASFAIPTR